jgi:tetratricopeptide (TPR) repeat protein
MKWALVVVATLLLTPVPAQAQRGGARSAKELIKEGERLYQQRKYLEAAAALEKANEMSPHPRLVYNIARAYDQAGRLREAMSYYQQYQSSPDGTDPLLLKRTALSLDRLRLQLEKEETTAAAAEAERRRLEEQAEEARRRAEAEREAARLAEEAHQLRLEAAHEEALVSRRRAQYTSFTLGGVALASAGVGTFFGLRANASRAEFDAATELEFKRGARDATRSNALLADIGFGVGLASAVAAVLLYPRQPVPRPGSARLTVAPHGAGAGVEVSF